MSARTKPLLVAMVLYLGCDYDLSKVTRPRPGDLARDAPADACGDAPADAGGDATADARADSAGDLSHPDAGAGDAGDLGTGDAALKPDVGPQPLSQFCSKDKWCWLNGLPQGNTLRGAWGASATCVYAVGGAGTVLRHDGGKWSAMAGATVEVLHDVWGAAHDDVYAVGDQGTICRARSGSGDLYRPQPECR